jgi:hypothetical protein
VKKLMTVEKTIFEFSDKEMAELLHVLNLMEFSTTKRLVSKFAIGPVTIDKEKKFIYSFNTEKGEMASTVIVINRMPLPEKKDDFQYEVIVNSAFDDNGNSYPDPKITPWSNVFNNALMRAAFRSDSKLNPLILPSIATPRISFQILGKWYVFYTWKNELVKENPIIDKYGAAIKYIPEYDNMNDSIDTTEERIKKDYGDSIKIAHSIGWNVLGQIPTIEDNVFSSVIHLGDIYQSMDIKKDNTSAIWELIETGKIVPILEVPDEKNGLQRKIEFSIGVISLLLQENKNNPKFSK